MAGKIACNFLYIRSAFLNHIFNVRAFLKCNRLQTEYNAVLESVLFNAIEYKTRYPGFSSDKVEQILLQVMNENSTHMVRYKAYLVLSFYRNYEAFDSSDDLVSLIETDKSNDVFFYIEKKIRDNQLTVR